VGPPAHAREPLPGQVAVAGTPRGGGRQERGSPQHQHPLCSLHAPERQAVSNLQALPVLVRAEKGAYLAPQNLRVSEPAEAGERSQCTTKAFNTRHARQHTARRRSGHAGALSRACAAAPAGGAEERARALRRIKPLTSQQQPACTQWPFWSFPGGRRACECQRMTWPQKVEHSNSAIRLAPSYRWQCRTWSARC